MSDPSNPPKRVEVIGRQRSGNRVYVVAAIGLGLIHLGWYYMQKTETFAPPPNHHQKEIIMPSIMPVFSDGKKEEAKKKEF